VKLWQLASLVHAAMQESNDVNIDMLAKVVPSSSTNGLSA
jgi:hypothetical protein